MGRVILRIFRLFRYTASHRFAKFEYDINNTDPTPLTPNTNIGMYKEN